MAAENNGMSNKELLLKIWEKVDDTHDRVTKFGEWKINHEKLHENSINPRMKMVDKLNNWRWYTVGFCACAMIVIKLMW